MSKVIDIEERIPAMREKRRRKTNRKFMFILAVFFAALLVVLYFQSPLSRIDEISVNGAVLNNQDDYKEKSGLLVDGPLWGFNAKNVETAISELNGVQNVSVQRRWPRHVDIEITEWKTVAYIEEGDQYSLLLENGETFPTEMRMPESEAPVLIGFADPIDRKKITSQLMKMKSDVYQLISEIIFTGSEEDSDKLTLYMVDGYEVHAVIPTLGEKLEFYPEFTAQLAGHEKGVIDIEVGAYFTPYSDLYGPIEEEEEETDAEEE